MLLDLPGWDSWSGGRRRYQGSSTRRVLRTCFLLIGFFCIQFDLSCRFCCSLSCSLPSMDFDHQKSLCQLHQFFISCDMVEGLHADVSVSIQTLNDKLGPSCQAAFTGVPACPPLCESAASKRYTAGHGSVGGGRISMPQVWLIH